MVSRAIVNPLTDSRRFSFCVPVMLMGILSASPTLAQSPNSQPLNSKTDNSETNSVKLSKDLTQNLPAAFLKPAPDSVTDLRAMEERVRKISRLVSDSTVGLQVGQAMGSGVIISADGYVLTAAHVISRPNRETDVILSDGRRLKGKTLGVIKGVDAGLVKILNGKDLPHVEMGDDNKAKIGSWCLSLGHPNGYQKGRPPVVRLGRLVGRQRSTLHTDCTLVGGDSGGPLFDISGNVIGIHSRIGKFNTRNYHVPVNEFHKRWNDLVAAKVIE